MPHADPEAARAWRKEYDRRRRMSSDFQAKEREYTRKWRAENPDKVKEQSRRRYKKHREKMLAQHEEYRRTPEGKRICNAKAVRWRLRNPEFVELRHAKKTIARALGLRECDINDDIAAAKAAQVKVGRAIRNAQGMEAEGRDEGTVHDSPVAESDAPQTPVNNC